MGAICVVQARTGSTRLPGKVLQDIAGHPMLGFILRRLASLDVDQLVVATSTAPGDDAVMDVATAAGAAVVRGDEHDVLARFLTVLAAHPADHVVRITADCPFTDPAIVGDVLALHEEAGGDYTSNIHPRTFPKGLDVEVCTAAALERIGRDAVGLEREHVMPHLYRHPAAFRIVGHWDGDRNGHRWWTVDTADDLEMARRLAESVADPVSAPWRSLLPADAAPPEVVLVPTTPDGAAMARAELGMPWAVELAVVGGGRVALGVDDAGARAVVTGSARDERIDRAIAQVVGVQADDIATVYDR
jgi:spore coat polysaccharide biosynthesis protein SpsF